MSIKENHWGMALSFAVFFFHNASADIADSNSVLSDSTGNSISMSSDNNSSSSIAASVDNTSTSDNTDSGSTVFTDTYIQNLNTMDAQTFATEMKKISDADLITLQSAINDPKNASLTNAITMVQGEAKARNDLATLTINLENFDPTASDDSLFLELEKPESSVTDYAGNKRYPAYAKIMSYDDLLKFETSVQGLSMQPVGLLNAIDNVKNTVLQPLQSLDSGFVANNSDPTWLANNLSNMDDDTLTDVQAVVGAESSDVIKKAIATEAANRQNVDNLDTSDDSSIDDNNIGDDSVSNNAAVSADNSTPEVTGNIVATPGP